MKWVVVKIGGGLADKAESLARITSDIEVLRGQGLAVVLVHGGGPQATDLSKKLGLSTQMVGGRRVTCESTLEVMKMVLCGAVSTTILSAFRKAGIPAAPLSGVADDVIQAIRRPPRIVSGGGGDPVDFGHVGDIEKIGTRLLVTLGSAGIVPVLNSLGADHDGNVLNINADIAATRVAEALGAEALFLVTGAPGVLQDPEDPTTRIPILDESSSEYWIREGIISGGMIPKLEESFGALRRGLGCVHILDAATPGGLEKEWNEPGSVGTALHL